MKKITALLFVLAACAHQTPEAQPTTRTPATIESNVGSITEAPKEKPAGINEAFVKDLQQIAAEYQSYGRADDFFHWAPMLCLMPSVARPGAHVSESADEKTHGKKLYSLFPGLMGQAQQGVAAPTDFKSQGTIPTGRGQELYLDVPKGGTIPEGFAIVKESWLPEEITDPAMIQKRNKERTVFERGGAGATLPHHEFWPYSEKDGRLYQAKEKAGLYVMYKAKAGTPGTDEGWVYGTLTADGKTVTSAGTVKTCMGCHTKAPYGRLFADKRANGD
jgi:hypothetical protein